MTHPLVAFLGPPGTFCEQALRSIDTATLADVLGVADAAPHSAATTTAALDAVRSGEAVAACVPIENSAEGAVPATMDGLVEDPPLVIVREVLLPVRFSVLVRPGTSAGDVRSVASHPHGAAQTRRWLIEHLPDAEVRMSGSTAAAAAQVAAGEVDAAVCAPVAAAHHGLVELASGVHDSGPNDQAVTRFVLVRRPGSPGLPAPSGADRTSLAATTVNRPGALLALLGEIAMRGVDLTRIESRPLKQGLGTYWFFLDGHGHVADEAMGEALAALHRRCTEVRFLGSYPRAGVLGAEPPPPPDPGHVPDEWARAARWLAAVRAGADA